MESTDTATHSGAFTADPPLSLLSHLTVQALEPHEYERAGQLLRPQHHLGDLPPGSPIAPDRRTQRRLGGPPGLGTRRPRSLHQLPPGCRQGLNLESPERAPLLDGKWIRDRGLNLCLSDHQTGAQRMLPPRNKNRRKGRDLAI